MVGIDKTKEVLTTLGNMVVVLVGLSKGGIRFTNLSKIVAIVQEMKVIATDFSHLLEEIQDLDGAECAELGELSFSILQQILSAFLEGDQGILKE